MYCITDSDSEVSHQIERQFFFLDYVQGNLHTTLCLTSKTSSELLEALEAFLAEDVLQINLWC